MGATSVDRGAAGSTAATCGIAPAAGGTDELAAAVRALPGAVVAFAAALAAGVPTRTSAQVSPNDAIRTRDFEGRRRCRAGRAQVVEFGALPSIAAP